MLRNDFQVRSVEVLVSTRTRACQGGAAEVLQVEKDKLRRYRSESAIINCSTLPAAQALAVCTWADVVIWKRPQTSHISCKTCHLHLQVPQHLKIPSSTYKYQSCNCKHVFLPPLISPNETEFAGRPQLPGCRLGVSPWLASPAAHIVHAPVSEDQIHFCNSN